MSISRVEVITAVPSARLPTAPLAPRLLATLFFLSGAAGLAYELIWTRQLCLIFGGSTYAITTTIAAFMAGLGLGSQIAGRASSRMRNPVFVYGMLEIAIGVYALVIPWLMHLAEPMYRALYARSADAPWLLIAARFAVSAVFLILPTTAMGATLPILVRFVTSRRESDESETAGRSVAFLYGINTLGAVAGALATGFWLIPALGMTMTTRAAAALNVIVGIVAIATLRSGSARRIHSDRAEPVPTSLAVSQSDPLNALPRRLLLFTFALSGFAAMIYQVAWTRTLVVSIGSSTYSFTCILAAFILGLALGSLAISRRDERDANRSLRLVALIEIAIGISGILVLPLFALAPALVARLVTRLSFPFSFIIAAEFAFIIAVTIVPTFCMGMLFPLVTRLISRGDDAGAATGRAYAVNTIGTIAGALLAGFWLIRGDVLGTRGSILLAALLNVLAGAVLIVMSRRSGESWLKPIGIAFAAVALVIGLPRVFGRWDPIGLTIAPFLAENVDQIRRAFTLRYFQEDVEMNVGVLASKTDDPPFLSLRVNGKADASTYPGDMRTQLWLGHLPALISPNAKKACVIGLGSGVTAAAIAQHPNIERIDCIELSRGVIDATDRCFSEANHDIVRQSRESGGRIRLICNDGRNHLLLTDQVYDLIVSEPSNPWISGVGNLFTEEFFELCKQRLSRSGRVCIWMHAYMMSEADFRMVARTLCRVFPYVSLWETSPQDYALIASRHPPRVPANDLLRNFHSQNVREDLYRGAGGSGAERALGRFIAGGDRLIAWAGDGTLHRDDNAALEFSAPRWVRGGAEVEIAQSLSAIRQSPFEEVVELTPGNPQHEKLRRRTTTVSDAGAARAKALSLGRRGEYLEALRTLVAAMQLDPDGAETREQALIGAQFLVTDTPPDDPRDAAEARALAVQITSIPEPIITPARGRSLEQIVADLRMKARSAESKERWTFAADYLEEAADLDPKNANALIEFAAALLMANRVDESLEALDGGLSRGVITSEAIASSRHANRFRENSRYAKFLATEGKH